METKKNITPYGKMSNLVGMYAFVWESDKIKARLFINGKADDFYIVQAVDGLDGSVNVCRLCKIEDMVKWSFYPTRDIADECFNDFIKHQTNRYKLPLEDLK